MKRIVRMSLVLLLVLLMLPFTAFAAPEGYLEVNLTKKNFSKYFDLKKVKMFDSSGNYDGYNIFLHSKVLKKGYYLYDNWDFAYKGKYTERYKSKSGKRTWTRTITHNSVIDSIDGWDKTFDFKYAKVSGLKISKAKGTIVFIKPDNMIGIDPIYNDEGKIDGYRLKFKHPYNVSTLAKRTYNEVTDQFTIEYYYLDRYGMKDPVIGYSSELLF